MTLLFIREVCPTVERLRAQTRGCGASFKGEKAFFAYLKQIMHLWMIVTAFKCRV